jgi:hypothetical protein
MRIGSIDTSNTSTNVYVGGELTGAAGTVTFKNFSLTLLSGTRSTAYSSAAKQEIGGVVWNPSVVGAVHPNRKVWFRAVLETTDANTGAYIELYDPGAIVTPTPGIVAGSTLTTLSLTPSDLEVDLTSTFDAIVAAGVIEARLWCDPVTVGQQVICKGARIDVEWT